MYENERYDFTVESNAVTVRPKRKHTLVKVTALLLACMIFALGGGALGTYLVINASDAGGTPAFGFRAPADGGAAGGDYGVVPAVISPAPLSDGKLLSLTDLFDGANPAVVAISTETVTRNYFGQSVTLPAAGSGFVISGDGYIATNNHVIEGASKIKALMSDGKSYDAAVVGADGASDLAVLKINASGLTYLTFGDSGKIKVGEQVAAIGNPLGEFANSLTVGYISALDREINLDGTPRHMLQTDTAVNGGNSGGPLLNLYGQVIGVVSAKSIGNNVEGIGFAIPSNRAADIINQLISDGYVKGRAWLGVSLAPYESYSQSYVYIAALTENGPASKAGLQTNDIILTANGTKITDVTSLKGVVNTLKPGDTLKLEIARNNKKSTADVTLGEYNPKEASFPAAENTPEVRDDSSYGIPGFPGLDRFFGMEDEPEIDEAA